MLDKCKRVDIDRQIVTKVNRKNIQRQIKGKETIHIVLIQYIGIQEQKERNEQTGVPSTKKNALAKKQDGIFVFFVLKNTRN